MIKERNCALKDILLWKSSRRKIKYANLPADTDLPNPVAWKDSLVVGTFSPQSITCLDRATGQHKWTKSLGRIGSATPTVSNNGLIFIPTQQSIECLDINNGNTLWSYAPHPQAAEAFYATPVISGNRLYISSTTGMTHCLNRTSGQPIWAMQVTQEGQMVNSTALVHSGLVIVGTNNRSVVAIDAKAGKARWQTRLDSNCTSRTLLVNGAAVVHTSSTAYFLDPSDGTVISKWRRRNWEIKGSTQNKNRLFLSISRVPQNYNTARLRDIPADPSERVVCLVDQQLQWDTGAPDFTWGLRALPQSRALCVLAPHRLLVYSTADGSYQYTIPIGGSNAMNPSCPDVVDEILYTQSTKGSVYALRLESDSCLPTK